MDTKRHIQIFMGEFLGTFVLMLFVDGVVVQHSYQNEENFFFHIAVGTGFGVMCGILVSVGASGGHLNPAVTLAFLAVGRCKLSEVPTYWISQYLSAFASAGAVYGIYYDLIDYQLSTNSTAEYVVAGYFATYPAAYDPGMATLVLDQILCTACLLIMVLAATDDRNMKVPQALQPFIIGLGIIAVLLSFNANAGCSMNPARDLSPRIVSWFFLGEDVWKWPETVDEDSCVTDESTGITTCDTQFEYFFWIPWLLPYVGALVGAAVYTLFITMHYEHESKEEEAKSKS